VRAHFALGQCVASVGQRNMRLPIIAAFAASTSAWTIPQLPSTHCVSRRHALAGCAAVSVLGFAPQQVRAANLPKQKLREADLKEQLVAILRVKESTQQETRLVSTGKYKEVQRLNVKRAVNMMVENSNLRDRFVRSVAYLPVNEQQQGLQLGQTAVEGLIQILEYFPRDLVANDLSAEQKKFVLDALTSTSKSIDSFMTLMPSEAVAAATRQIEEENQLNLEEYPKDEPQLNFGAGK